MERAQKRASEEAKHPPSSPLGLHRWIPQRDVRRLIWRHLSTTDQAMVWLAHVPHCAIQHVERHIYACIHLGHVARLAWLYQHRRKSVRIILDNEPLLAMRWAAVGGHVDAMQWVHEHLEGVSSTWWDSVTQVICEHGHVDAMQWLADLLPSIQQPRHLYVLVLRRNHVDLLNWMLCRRKPAEFGSLVAQAVRQNATRALQCLWRHGLVERTDDAMCMTAARLGHLEILQWATANGFPWDPYECTAAARAKGHTRIVEWIANL
jgi:hypothetical protein